MANTRSAGTGPRLSPAAPPSTRGRPGLRGTLLSAAVAILLLGAATAGAYGYAAIIHR